MSKIIRFEIDKKAYEIIRYALSKYKNNEIGGILIGYLKKKNHFVIANATIADDCLEFNISSFVREPIKSFKILYHLFKTKKYNYIGEWHSHPCFNLNPSQFDINTMNGIINDKRYNVNFALMIITHLKNNKMHMEGYLFHRDLNSFVNASLAYK